MTVAPTIVLIHGAFGDASHWAPVTERLQAEGHEVLVPPVFNRGLWSDSAYIKSFVEDIEGPVVLVGHSYGGAILTIAGAAENVIGMVFVSAFILDGGESIGELQSRFADSELADHLLVVPVPSSEGRLAMDFSIDSEGFASVFAEGVDSRVAKMLAVSQRPIAASVFAEPASANSWSRKPSWGIISSADRIINPDLMRYCYQRAALEQVLEIDGPHLITYTHPTEVAAFIVAATTSFARRPLSEQSFPKGDLVSASQDEQIGQPR
jgi:pimeloyl-ACP methyl ester carboxylesterase